MINLLSKRLFLLFFVVLFSALLLSEIREFARTKKLVNSIVTNIIAQPNTEGEIGTVKNTLATVRELSKPRTDFFQDQFNYSDDYLEAFFSGSGACGMYSLFTCRLLTEMGYECRVVQQKVQGTWGGHITLEVNLNRFNRNLPDRWMLIDPLFNHVFVDSQHRELSAMQVKEQWPKSLVQLPVEYDIFLLPTEYDMKYNYQEGYRYTNWDKLGVLSRGVYSTGKLIGLPMDTFSFRAMFIRQHFWNLTIYGLCLTLILLIGFRDRLKMGVHAIVIRDQSNCGIKNSQTGTKVDHPRNPS
jgi:hypothetical protein